MVSNRIKSDARAHMAQHPGASYQTALRAVSGAESSNRHAPDGPTLFDALGIDDIDTHDFTAVWRENAYTDEIRVPFGYRFDGDEIAAEPASLNFYDMNRGGDGPHGGVVGRTGSGKSLFLRGLVLSLVSRYGPDKVALVLADFKGGATFWRMNTLPHVAANVFNLDNDAAMVELLGATLLSEIDRRQQFINGDKQLADIFDYRDEQEKHQGDPEWPALPDLIVIVDELSAFPESNLQFAEQLISVGRLGRTLGVHLLLGGQTFPGPGQKMWADAVPKSPGAFHAQSFHETLQNLMAQLGLRITVSGPVSDQRPAAWAGGGVTSYCMVRDASHRSDTFEVGPDDVQLLAFTGADTDGSPERDQDTALIERLSTLTSKRILDLGITPALLD